MFKSKKKPGKFKENVVFKFQFHLTRVPQAGWDKLKVSVIPLKTGKASNKTTKAFVQYGTCRWPDPIVEAAKLYLDISSGRYDDKFYKLVVGSRSKLLGEVTINLAQYVNSAPSNLVAFPLKNCQGNTILHAKIHSLTSIRKSREYSVQDDQSSDSEGDLEGDLEDNSVESSTSQAPTPTSTRDNMSAPRYSSDALTEPLTPKDNARNGNAKDFYIGGPPSPSSSINSTGQYEQRRRRFSQSSVSATSERQLPRSSSTGLPFLPGHSGSLEKTENGTPKHSRSFSLRSNSASERDFASIEKTGEGLRMEAVTWQRRAQNLGLEVQRLKHELNELMKQRVDQRTEEELSENFKLELQSAKQVYEDNEEKLRKEGEEYKRSIRELRAELGYEKEANVSANLQLRKAQESNMQLVLAIQDMEESLEEQRKEMEDLSSLNNKLETSLLDGKLREQNLERQLSEKLSAKEEIIKRLQEKLVKPTQEPVTEESRRLDISTQDVKEMERELKELTEENMELIYKLNKVTKEKDALVAEADPEEMKRVKGMVNELEKKLIATEEFHQAQHASNEKLMVRLQTLIHGLKSANADLESQLRSSDDDINNLNKEFEHVKSECAAYETKAVEQQQLLHILKEKAATLENDYASAVRTITDSEAELGKLRDKIASAVQEQQKLEVSVADLNSQKADLECQAAKSLAQIQKHENEIAELLHKLGSKLSHISDLQARILQLEMLNSGLDIKMQDSQELDKLNKSRILELELHVSALIEELQSLNEYKQELESKAHILETERDELSSQLKSEQATRKTLEENVFDLGRFRQDLEVQVRRLKKENVEFVEKVTRLEAEAGCLMAELEACKHQEGAAKNEALESEKAKVMCAAALNEYKSKCANLNVKVSLLEQEFDLHQQVRQDLELQAEGLKSKIASHLSSKAMLESRIQELEESLVRLKHNHGKAEHDFDLQVAGLEKENVQLVAEVSRLEAEVGILREELKDSKLQKAAAESQKRMLEAALNEYKSNCIDLDAKMLVLDRECSFHKQARQDLEIEVERIRSEITAHLSSDGRLQARIKELEESLADGEKCLENLEQVHAEAVAVKISLEAQVVELTCKLKQYLQEKEVLVSSCNAQKEKTLKAEDLLQTACQEKERLQLELQGLSGELATVREKKEKLSVEFSDMKIEKSLLEDMFIQTQKHSEEANAELESSRALYEMELKAMRSELEESTQKYVELATHMDDAMDLLTSAKTKCESKLSECEKEILLSKSDQETLIQENCEFKAKVLECDLLAILQATLLNSRQEKSALELSLQKLGEERSRLQEQSTFFEEQLDKLKGTFTNISQDQEKSALELNIQKVAEEKLRLQEQGTNFEEQLGELKATLCNVIQEKSALELIIWRLEEEHSKERTFFEKQVDELQGIVLNVSQEKSALELNILRIQDQGTNFEEQFDELKATVLNVRQEKSALELSLQELEEEKSTLRGQSTSFEQQLDELRVTLLNVSNEKSALELNVQKLEEEQSRLRGHEQQLDELRATLANVSNEKSALELNVQKLEEELSRLQQQSTFFEAQLEILKQSTTAKLTERRAAIQAKLQTFRAELDARLVMKREQLNEPIQDGVETKQKQIEESEVLAMEIQHLEQACKQEEFGWQEETILYAKLAFWEAQITKEDEMDALKRDYQEKEATLQNRIEHLETTIEAGEMDTGLEQFQYELTRLQEQLSLTSQRERELLLTLGTHELLEKEVRRLQQVNEQLENTITRVKAASAWDDQHDKILILETELTEALEANAMYKSQLQRAFGVQQHVHAAAMHNLGSIDQIISDLLGYKRKSSELDKALKEMQDRYSGMSLKFAEVVAEKEALLMTLRNLQRSSEVLSPHISKR